MESNSNGSHIQIFTPLQFHETENVEKIVAYLKSEDRI